MRIISLTICHYGVDFLPYALKSVHDAVDAQYVLYTPEGSHGHKTSAVCPDTREMLIEAAIAGAGSKLRWHEGVYANESEHRAKIHELEPDCDLIVVTDYDEIWQPGLAEYAIKTALENDVRRWRVPFRHYFRSFYKCILHDPAYPERIIKPKASGGIETLNTTMAVNHFGYSITLEMMEYKWRIHGHLSEMRRDVDYLNDVYKANRQTDVHPVGSIYWNPETVDPFAENWLPNWMHEHPYSKVNLIE